MFRELLVDFFVSKLRFCSFSWRFENCQTRGNSENSGTSFQPNARWISRTILRNSVADFHLAFTFSFPRRGELSRIRVRKVQSAREKTRRSERRVEPRLQKAEDTGMEMEDTAAGEQNFSTSLSYPRWRKWSYREERAT